MQYSNLKIKIVCSWLALTAAAAVCMADNVVWNLTPDNVVMAPGTTVKPGKTLLFHNEKSGVRLVSKDIIRIEPEAEYQFIIKAKVPEDGKRLGLTLICFDKNGKQFDPASIAALDDYGVVSAPVRRGDKTLKISGAEKWGALKTGTLLVFNAKKDGSDLPNLNRSAAIKSISADGTVELTAPLRRKYSAGTVVRRHLVQGGEDTITSLSPPGFMERNRPRKGISAKGREGGKFMYAASGFKIALTSKARTIETAYVTVKKIMPRQKGKPVALGQNARAELVKKALAGEINTARLSWWGYKEDATELLQNAVDSKVSKLIIDNIGKPWVTATIELRSDLEIVFEDGALVEAKPGAFVDRISCHFVGRNVRNVTIRGEGSGGIIRMRKRDYQDPKRYVHSEHRHCVAFYNGKNIRVENMKLLSSGGDGVIIAAVGREFSENVVLRKLLCDDNHRQGISIITGRNILIEDCILSNTNGTPPMAGIDIETNHNFEPATNIVVRNCKMINNMGPGIGISITRMNTDISGKVDILFENCELIDNFRFDVGVHSRSRWPRGVDKLAGSIVFRNMILRNFKHKNRRRYVIDSEIDNFNALKVSFDNVEILRGPVKNPAIRIANCSPDGRTPQSQFTFRNINFKDVPADQRFAIFDHSFTADPEWIKGLGYTPVRHRKVAPFSGAAPVPEKFSGVRKYKALFTIFQPDFWAYGEAGKDGGVTFEYRSMGYRSRMCRITMVSPSGKRREIATMNPGDIKTLKLNFSETGYHKLEMRGFYEQFALKSSTVPAGLYIPDHGAHFIQSTGCLTFRVPENSRPFAVRAWGRNNILWCGVELFTPDGRKVWDTVTNHAQFEPDGAMQKISGVWKLRLKHPGRTFGKCHIALPGLPPYAVPECEE